MESCISILNLTKNYKNGNALDDISLDIRKGKIVGLLGKNGAGKTTLLKICMGLIKPDSGSITILDYNPLNEEHLINKEVSFIPDKPGLMGWITIKEFFKFVSGIYPHWDNDKSSKLLNQSGLDSNMKIKNLSKGMLTKLYLVYTLSIKSQLMILDEPTLGLDISAKRIFFDTLLEDYCNDNRTIFISTHQVEEMENILEEVIIIHNGHIVIHDTVENLKQKFSIIFMETSEKESFSDTNTYKLGSLAGKTAFITTGITESELTKEIRQPTLSEIFLGIVEGGLR